MEEDNKRYILCASDTSESYLDFGARFIEPVYRYKVVEVAAWNAEWQAGRLRSGRCNKGTLSYYNTLRVLKEDAYALAMLEGVFSDNKEAHE